MLTMAVSDFRLSFTFFHRSSADQMLRDRVDHFMMSVSRSYKPIRGSFMAGQDSNSWLEQPRIDLAVETVMTGLRHVRARRAEGKGIVDVAGPLPNHYAKDRPTLFQQGSLAEGWQEKQGIREPIDCPCVVALIAYVEHGDEADLCAAMDMLTDAGKFN